MFPLRLLMMIFMCMNKLNIVESAPPVHVHDPIKDDSCSCEQIVEQFLSVDFHLEMQDHSLLK